MQITPLHRWDLSYEEAGRLQTELSSRIILSGELPQISYIAGCDVSSEWRGKIFYAAIVIMSYPELYVVEEASAVMEVGFPYVPGLLSFREMPVLLKAWEKISIVPDLIMCDGSGLIHPRFFGLACHLGLWLNLPAIGAAKNLLCGAYDNLSNTKGSTSPVIYKGKFVGAALRTRSGVKPVFVSPGHLISIDDAVKHVLNAAPNYRLPEPLRAAHRSANDARRAHI